MSRPVHIVGVGSLGAFFAERFQAAGHAVTLERRGEAPRVPSRALVLVAVKAYDLAAAAESLKKRVTAAEPVVILSNGLGLMTEIGAPREWIRGLAWFGVARDPASGELRFAGEAPLEFVGGDAPSRTEIAQAFVGAGFSQARALEEPIERAEWRKALLNLALNGIAARERVPNGALLERSDLRDEARQITREAVAVALARGVDLGGDETAWARVQAGLEATRLNRCSTLQDVEAGRRTEIPWLNGRVVEFATLAGLKSNANLLISQRFDQSRPGTA